MWLMCGSIQVPSMAIEKVYIRNNTSVIQDEVKCLSKALAVTATGLLTGSCAQAGSDSRLCRSTEVSVSRYVLKSSGY